MALLLIPLFLALLYLLVILPQQRRVRAHEQVVQAVAEGDEVMTTSGVYGTVVSVGDDVVVLAVAPGVEMRIARASVGLIVDPEVPNAAGDLQTSEDSTRSGPDAEVA